MKNRPHVAQALVPAASRLFSTLVLGFSKVRAGLLPGVSHNPGVFRIHSRVFDDAVVSVTPTNRLLARAAR